MSNIATTKPELKFEGKVLSVKASVGVDTDGDGAMAAGLKAEFFVDGEEALNEIFKNGIPDWALKLIGVKATEEQKAALVA